jgi:hypothetical protein
METKMHPIFQSYREYVAKCIVESTEPKSLSEFTGSNDALKVEETEEELTHERN